MVRVRLYGSLRAIVGRDEVVIDASRLNELLKVLEKNYVELAEVIKSENFVVLVNEKPVPMSALDLELNSEDVVDILPVVSGGC
ncbi:MAG: MoaD/ThiS family protein [Sulfolobales archaeon]|nr:MoaD/ThiS family protein [Sulfolobales archaeon]MCX8208710.1 MoaD/ThiS family protein [Sulfolobales archaeon]MDW8011290.1 MoaD/ThiS family protein [Sulfolobales archaeon]